MDTIIWWSWTQPGGYNIIRQSILIASLLSLIGLTGACSSYRPTPIPFDSAPAMELHLESYKKWLSAERDETEDVKSQLGPFFKDLLYRDFSFYEKIYPSFEVYTQSYDSVKALGTKQYRLVKTLKRRKKPDINGKIRRGSTDTFLERFTQNDLSIQRYQHLHDYHKSKLVELFEKKNYRCVFIKDQILEIRPEILELQFRKNALVQYEDDLLREFSKTITEEQDGASGFLQKKIERVQTLNGRIAKLDDFFENIEKMAKKEISGTMFISPIGTPPKEYEVKIKEALITYQALLDELKGIYTN